MHEQLVCSRARLGVIIIGESELDILVGGDFVILNRARLLGAVFVSLGVVDDDLVAGLGESEGGGLVETLFRFEEAR